MFYFVTFSYSHVGATIDLFDDKSLGKTNKPK